MRGSEVLAWLRRLAPVMPLILTAPLFAQAPPTSLNYEFFRDRVQPIFLKKRPGHARCISCHENREPMLQHLSPGASIWDEEQSRKNFVSWQRVVAPGDPQASRMLMHPLAKSGGGDAFHAGGKHWKTQEDPEWQTLAAWVQTAASPTVAGSSLDFEFYRTRVEPIFLKPRGPQEGVGLSCATCHTKLATRLRLQPLANDATSWTMEQSRSNFVAASRVIVPGDVTSSALLLNALATEAGGSAAHAGGKFWTSRDHPEWQTLAAWVRGQTSGSPK